MTDTLAQLIDKVQGLLGDTAGTYFSDALCTNALRQALAIWNMSAPQQLAETITAVDNQYEYELSDEDADACEITDILRQGTDTAQDKHISLVYDDYIEDERLFFRLRTPEPSSRTLIARYQKYHTINGLDSATESTLSARYDQAIANGGAFFAIFIRAVARVETINLSQDQSDNYRELAPTLGGYFSAMLARAARRRAPVGEPDEHAWQDEYETPSWDMKG